MTGLTQAALDDVNLWPAAAKLNLFLHITGRRADGYHELQTMFQMLDYGDRIRCRVRDDGQIHRLQGNAIVPESQDLMVRAATLLQQRGAGDLGVDISIEKRIPMGGGLGGGSSDAATVLHALNCLWQLRLSTDELANIGLQLGADVPVFVHGESAWGEGVGERLTAVELPELWFLVVTPDVFVSTGDLFAASELTRDVRPITIRDYLEGGGLNVFEPVVRSQYPIINDALDWLTERSSVPAKLTGTGSSIFVALENEAQAKTIAAQTPETWQAFWAKAINQSPLRVKLNALQ